MKWHARAREEARARLRKSAPGIGDSSAAAARLLSSLSYLSIYSVAAAWEIAVVRRPYWQIFKWIFLAEAVRGCCCYSLKSKLGARRAGGKVHLDTCCYTSIYVYPSSFFLPHLSASFSRSPGRRPRAWIQDFTCQPRHAATSYRFSTAKDPFSLSFLLLSGRRARARPPAGARLARYTLYTYIHTCSLACMSTRGNTDEL